MPVVLTGGNTLSACGFDTSVSLANSARRPAGCVCCSPAAGTTSSRSANRGEPASAGGTQLSRSLIALAAGPAAGCACVGWSCADCIGEGVGGWSVVVMRRCRAASGPHAGEVVGGGSLALPQVCVGSPSVPEPSVTSGACLAGRAGWSVISSGVTAGDVVGVLGNSWSVGTSLVCVAAGVCGLGRCAGDGAMGGNGR